MIAFEAELNAECLPISVMPGLSKLFVDFCAGDLPKGSHWFAVNPRDQGWQSAPQTKDTVHRAAVADLLARQNPSLSGTAGLLAAGANAVVTGQQVGLFGGPLYTIHKAITAIALAQQSSATGNPHLPIFWLATEDHDFAEVNHVTFPSRYQLSKLSLEPQPTAVLPAGSVVLGEAVKPLIDRAWELIGYSDAMEALAAAYQPGRTMGQAFAEFYRGVFNGHGLLVLDPAGREAHSLGAPVLQAAIERADELHAALVERNRQLAEAGYHAQVAVADRNSLLFLIDSQSGARVALRRTSASADEPGGLWTAGRASYSTADLLGILEAEPERISPSALLRPIFQDQILPTSAYIGGPAEIAYFAQSAVLYDKILGRLTPVLPRLSVTLIEPAIAQLLERHELSFEAVLDSTEESLAQRLAARAIPIQGKQRLASAGNALDTELTALTGYMAGLDEGLGRSAVTAASKMRYQMNRLRRLAASYELQQEASLGRHAQALTLALHPNRSLQERELGAAWFLGRYGSALVDKLLAEAGDNCPGHKLVRL